MYAALAPPETAVARVDRGRVRCYVVASQATPSMKGEGDTKGPIEKDERWMRAALDEALKALEAGDVPVGAVVVHEDRIIGRGHNQVEGLGDPTAHAEILAIGAASSHLGAPRLTGADIYVTMEPCPMCAGAIVLARIRRLVYGCSDAKAGYCGTLGNIVDDPGLNHRVSVRSGILEQDCASIVSRFFADVRRSDGV